MDYINVNDVTDVNKLKALYYDQLVIKQQADSNLVIINQRINELLATVATPGGDKANG